VDTTKQQTVKAGIGIGWVLIQWSIHSVKDQVTSTANSIITIRSISSSLHMVTMYLERERERERRRRRTRDGGECGIKQCIV
jgi:nicotinamide riboside transporter PnuC